MDRRKVNSNISSVFFSGFRGSKIDEFYNRKRQMWLLQYSDKAYINGKELTKQEKQNIIFFGTKSKIVVSGVNDSGAELTESMFIKSHLYYIESRVNPKDNGLSRVKAVYLDYLNDRLKKFS